MTLWTLLMAIGLILIMFITMMIGRWQQKNATVRFSRKFGLDVPAGMEANIRASVMARHIGALIGTIIAVILATILILVFANFQLLAAWWVLFASYLIGAGIGSTVAILLAERKREQGVVRVARSSAVTVDDYVSPLQAGVARVSVVIGVLAFAGDCWLALVNSSRFLSIVSAVFVVLSIALLVAYEVIARRLVAKGALAGTTLELAWDDGLRAYALSNLNSMVALLGLYSFIAYDTLLVSGPTERILSEPVFQFYTGFFPIAATVAVLTLVVAMTRVRSRQYFLRRLWPDLAVHVDANVAGAYTSMMGGR